MPSTVFQIELQISVVCYVFRFVEQIRHEFLTRHPRTLRIQQTDGKHTHYSGTANYILLPWFRTP